MLSRSMRVSSRLWSALTHLHNRVKNMSPDEEMLYGYIQDAAREGIWTRTLKMKSNLHNTTMSKCLKTLENKRFIKAIQSVKVIDSHIPSV